MRIVAWLILAEINYVRGLPTTKIISNKKNSKKKTQKLRKNIPQ